MDTSYLKKEHIISTKWTHHIYKMNTSYLQNEHIISIKWTHHIYKMNTSYLQNENIISTKWKHHIYKMNTSYLQNEHIISTKLTHHIYKMNISCLQNEQLKTTMMTNSGGSDLWSNTLPVRLRKRPCVCWRMKVCLCVYVSFAVCYKAQAQRNSNREFKLWTILQGTESWVATFHAETCVMSHQVRLFVVYLFDCFVCSLADSLFVRLIVCRLIDSFVCWLVDWLFRWTNNSHKYYPTIKISGYKHLFHLKSNRAIESHLILNKSPLSQSDKNQILSN